jgi:hypothetical protein
MLAPLNDQENFHPSPELRVALPSTVAPSRNSTFVTPTQVLCHNAQD